MRGVSGLRPACTAGRPGALLCRSSRARAFAERGVYVGIRGSCIRVAPHLHAPLEAMDRFIEALKAVAA